MSACSGDGGLASISSSSNVGSTTDASMIRVEMYPFETEKASMIAKKAAAPATTQRSNLSHGNRMRETLTDI